MPTIAMASRGALIFSCTVVVERYKQDFEGRIRDDSVPGRSQTHACFSTGPKSCQPPSTISPFVLVGIGISRWMARFDLAKKMTFWALVVEGVTLAIIAGVLFFGRVG
jgi:hypothetical protein